MTTPTEQPPQKSPSVFSVTLSIILSLIGAQRRKTLENDIAHGKVSTFIIAGVIVVALFIFMVCSLVKAVLPAGT
jgi:uncharacterized membrane protein YidH (DUF202 family)